MFIKWYKHEFATMSKKKTTGLSTTVSKEGHADSHLKHERTYSLKEVLYIYIYIYIYI